MTMRGIGGSPAGARARVLGGLACVAMMMGMPAAHADSSPPASWTVVYDGDARFVQTGPDGPTVPNEYAETLTLDCAADGCEYTNANPLFPPFQLALSGDAPPATTSWASSGDFCEGTGLAAGTATATVADQKLTIEITTAGFGWQDCAHGRDYGFAQALTVTADWQSGDLCPLTPAGCAGVDATSADDAGMSEVTLLYRIIGEWRLWSASSPDSVQTMPFDLRLPVHCQAEVCRIDDAPDLWPVFAPQQIVATFAVPGSLDVSQASSGATCADDYRALRTGALVFTAEGVTGAGDEEALIVDCGDYTLGRNGSAWAITSSSLLEGHCWFEQDGCAVPEQRVDAATAAGDQNGVPGAAGSSSRLGTGSPAAPSVLSALATPATAIATATSPTQLLAAAILTVVLVLLMSFPTSLLNRAVDAFADRLARRRTARRDRGGATPTKSERSWTRTWWWAATGILLAAVLSAFVDPQFGWNPGSVRTVASILLGFAVDIMLGWVAVIWVMRRLMPQATHSFSFRPLSLLIVVVGVVFTRLTGFEPGIVFGLVAGIGFAGAVGRAAKARSALIGLGFAFAVAIVAWLVYGLVADQSGTSLVATLLVEALASMVVGGIVGLPLALVPLRGLSGRAIWEANRTTWFACYAVGVFALFVVVLPMPGSWAEVSWSLGAWVAMYVAYAAVAVVAWAAVVQPWRAAPESADAASAAEEPTQRAAAEPDPPAAAEPDPRAPVGRLDG